MRYAVVGGGASGLAAAFYLRRANAGSVTLLESSHRLGGWVDSTSFPGGARHDHGPRTIRPAGAQGANTLQLAQDLGLADSVVPVPPDHPAATNRYVLVGGRLHRLPSSFGSLFRRLPPFSRPLALSALTDLTTPPKKCADDNVYDFVARRLGEDVAKYAVDPMVRGICAGDARQISAESFVLGPLFAHEQESGGIFRGMVRGALAGRRKEADGKQCELARRARSERWNVWSLRGGLGTMVEALEDRLAKEGVEVATGCPVSKVSRGRGDHRVGVTTADGTETSFDHVFLACPASVSSGLLSDASPSCSSLLGDIPFVTVAVVSMEFDGGDAKVPDAFGFLVPSSEPEPLLGVIFDSCTFPHPEGRTLLTAMLGGHHFDRLFGSSTTEEIEETATGAVAKVLGISRPPLRVVTRVQSGCIPQYTVGHGARVREARRSLEGGGLERVSLVGFSYDGVGINDAIMSARRQVEKALLQE